MTSAFNMHLRPSRFNLQCKDSEENRLEYDISCHLLFETCLWLGCGDVCIHSTWRSLAWVQAVRLILAYSSAPSLATTAMGTWQWREHESGRRLSSPEPTPYPYLLCSIHFTGRVKAGAFLGFIRAAMSPETWLWTGMGCSVPGALGRLRSEEYPSPETGLIQHLGQRLARLCPRAGRCRWDEASQSAAYPSAEPGLYYVRINQCSSGAMRFTFNSWDSRELSSAVLGHLRNAGWLWSLRGKNLVAACLYALSKDKLITRVWDPARIR